MCWPLPGHRLLGRVRAPRRHEWPLYMPPDNDSDLTRRPQVLGTRIPHQLQAQSHRAPATDHVFHADADAGSTHDQGAHCYCHPSAHRGVIILTRPNRTYRMLSQTSPTCRTSSYPSTTTTRPRSPKAARTGPCYSFPSSTASLSTTTACRPETNTKLTM